MGKCDPLWIENEKVLQLFDSGKCEGCDDNTYSIVKSSPPTFVLDTS
jgi:hypothetical protein